MKGSAKKGIYLVVGLAGGLFLLWFLFRSVDPQKLWVALRSANLFWLTLTLVPLLGSFVLRIHRWKYVVRAVEPHATFRQMFSATQIGFLANFTLPARAGEFVRAIALARLAKTSFSKSMATVTLDRVNDLIGLLFVIVVALSSYQPAGSIAIPGELFDRAEDILMPAAAYWIGMGAAVGLLIGVISALVLLYLFQDLAFRLSDACLGLVSKKLAHRVRGLLEQFAEGLHIFRSGSDILKSVGFSLITWVAFLGIGQCVLEAFAVDCPWYTIFVLQAGIAVAISVPGAPGFVGQFHVPVVAGLIMVAPNVPLEKDLAVAIVIHLVNVAAVFALGIGCLFLEGFSLTQLSRESEAIQDSAESDPAAS